MAPEIPPRKDHVALVTLPGHRVWADKERWYADDTEGEFLLTIFPDDVHSMRGNLPLVQIPVSIRLQSIQ
jgi:hypothetical protein